LEDVIYFIATLKIRLASFIALMDNFTLKTVVMHPEFSDNEEDAWKNDIAVL